MEATIHRATAVRRGVRLELITVAWMAAEGVLVIGAGIAVRSVLFTAFGFDSVIELLSGVVLLRRLSAEARGANAESVDRLEHATVRISALLLILLCVYVVAASIAGLATQLKAEGSALGIAVTGAALVVMPLLAFAKSRANTLIASASLRADITETVTCAYMAAVTLAGIALSSILGAWWIQYLASLALLLWLVPETREALEASRGHRHD